MASTRFTYVQHNRSSANESELARITARPDQCGGRPRIRALRVRVKDTLDLLAAGATRAQILEDYPDLEAADITAALEFAARETDHRSSAWPDAFPGRCAASACTGKLARRTLAHGGTRLRHLACTPPTIESFWDYAVSVRAVSVTKDENFALRRTLADAGPQIVWVHRGTTGRRDLLAWFEPLLPTVIDMLSGGEPLVGGSAW